MRYYIIKPRSKVVNSDLLDEILKTDKDAVLVSNLRDCNIAVLQDNWCRSKHAIAEWHKAESLGIKCIEEYAYNIFNVHLN